MTTDAHRAFAREQAAAIYKHHLETSNGLGADANHIATEITYEESLYRGLLAECDFAVTFGMRVNRTIHQHGDGGLDFPMRLRTDSGTVHQFPLNVKAKSVKYGWSGWNALVASGTHLRIPVHEVYPRTIYVLAVYLIDLDEAKVLRWAWGNTIIKRNDRRVFKNSKGQQNYLLPFEDLRDLVELKERMA